MSSPTRHPDEIFARVVVITDLAEQRRVLAHLCDGHPALLREVQSLLEAHEQAGQFLQSDSPAAATTQASLSGLPPTHPALQAGEFLRQSKTADAGAVTAFLARLPAAIRAEARERIEAGLRLRQLPPTPSPAQASAQTAAPALPGFRIDRLLGTGGLGAVFAAHDEKLNRRVAIKVLKRRGDPSIRRRLLDEARKAAALSDPAVVTIYSVLDEADPPAIIMEMVDGFPIDRIGQNLAMPQKAGLLREVARGLAAAHAHGLVHRDLKPDNIMVGADLRPRILDFGLALSLEEASQSELGFAGTPLYASPEQVMGRPLTGASDVFSFGSLMFKVLTGRPPFSGETLPQVLEAITTTDPPFLRDVAVGVPEELQAICMACLAWSPEDRPSALEVANELGRYLVGEPVRLKPKLYEDLLRRSISEYANQARAWQSQSIISRDEQDSLEIVHRRLLADEDHWIIEARRITPLQAILSGATWLAVVASMLMVWMLRDELNAPWRWLLPTVFACALLSAGHLARRAADLLAAATFLAGAALAVAPCVLALMAEAGLFAQAPPGVEQLFEGSFTNQQFLAASLIALGVSAFGLHRLQMTGFAWTTAGLGTCTYLSLLLALNWLHEPPETKALWCLPLTAAELIALHWEKRGRVRWTLPFHLVALVALVASLDVMALQGPTLQMLGVTPERWSYFDPVRQRALSVVLNGAIFLLLMLASERSQSLDMRRAAKLLEVLAILHTLSALFANALAHQNKPHVRADVALYLLTALLFVVMAPQRSRWRLLVGGLAGCGLGCYLLIYLELVAKKSFIITLGFGGLLAALGTYAVARWKFLVRRGRSRDPARPQTG